MNAPQPVQQNKEKKKDAARALEETAFDSAAPIQLPINLASPLTYRHNLLQLQRLIGNQATIRLLKTISPRIQRRVELTEEQIREGIQYYQMLPDRTLRILYAALLPRQEYNFAQPHPDLVRAAAEWQLANAPDQVNGRLTQAQIETLTTFGLERESEREAYVDYTMERVEGRWGELNTPEQRMEAIMGGVNTRLDAIGVPGCGYAISSSLGTEEGAEFDELEWRVNFKRSVLAQGNLEYLMSAAYHEGRHAEQTFLAMRYMLAANDAATLASQVFRTILGSIHRGALARARTANASGAMDPVQWAMARTWFLEKYWNEQETSAVYTRWDETAQALREARASGDPERIRRAEAAYQSALRAYRALSGEADAYRVGGAVAQDFRQARSAEDASVTPETAPTTG